MGIRVGLVLVGFVMALASMGSADRKPAMNAMCRKVVLNGEVAQGVEWKAQIGQGWVFRVMPIGGADFKSYSGWDLVMDRSGIGAGYPDGLLLASPPYGSLNEREIGTTFGLRAQDAIGWGPRHFRFLTDAQDLARARVLFREVMNASVAGRGPAAGTELLTLAARGSAGEFTVQDARFTAGTGDPAPFARQWAEHLKDVPHTVEQSLEAANPSGELRWMRFSVTLWLPRKFGVAPGLGSELVKCTQ